MLTRTSMRSLGRTPWRSLYLTPSLGVIPRQITSHPWSRPYSSQRHPPSDSQHHEDKTLPQTPGNKDTQSDTPPSPPSSDHQTTAGAEPEAQDIRLEQLHDLTRGIPSTIDYELAGKDPRTLPAPSEGRAGGDDGGPRGRARRPEYVSSSDRRRSKLARWMYIGLLSSATGVFLYQSRDWSTPQEELRHADVPRGIQGMWQRAKIRSTEWLSYYQEPAFEKLLPDPDAMLARPYTLVLSLEDLLVHNEWTRTHGWRVAKRPGLDYFLRYLSQYYELVLFTSQPYATIEPVTRKLDPYHVIIFSLFREATKYKDGQWVKDLSYLNRDLSKVILLDTDPSHASAQPENAIIMPKWKGDPKDKDLVALIPFLEYIHTVEVPDVRRVLESFKGTHIPTEFARRESIARREFEKAIAARGAARHSEQSVQGVQGMVQSAVSSLLAGLGLKTSKMSMMQQPEGVEDPVQAYAKGKMLQDIARERGQLQYEALEKEIRENGEKWLKEEAAQLEKLQKEAMTSMRNTMWGSLTGLFGGSADQSSEQTT